jgi:6,7-dimethyl-8-ribityllumazine synthase
MAARDPSGPAAEPAGTVALDARGLRFALVAARFNESWVRRLVDGAREVLARHGADASDLEPVWVPGSLELPLACRWVAEARRPDAILAFGVVIRGETEHFRLVAEVSAHGLGTVALQTGIPVLNCVLAAHDVAQVEDRAGGRVGNKGAETALAAMRMARLRHELEAR